MKCTVFAVALVVFQLLFGSGCVNIPQTITVDPAFDEQTVAILADVRDAWCEKSAYCPELVSSGGEGAITLRVGTTAPGPGEFKPGATTNLSKGTMVVNDWVIKTQPDLVWVMFAHEFGHLQGIRHHGRPGCTMYPTQPEEVYEVTCE